MSVLETVKESLESAQQELVEAELSLIEITVKTDNARLSVSRLTSALAALNGEVELPKPSSDSSQERVIDDKTLARAETVELSPEEFNKQRLRRQRTREKERIANDPYGHVKCPGCGINGKLIEQVLQGGGAAVRMLVCGGCNNQMMI